MCTPKRAERSSASWQREAWLIDASSEGGWALYETIEVAARPHGCPSGLRAVTTATPDASDAIASTNSS